ncbi:hypothetical protein ADUPG1_005858, partial [Aduncisulcus paluster]
MNPSDAGDIISGSAKKPSKSETKRVKRSEKTSKSSVKGKVKKGESESPPSETMCELNACKHPVIVSDSSFSSVKARSLDRDDLSEDSRV